MKKNGFTGKLTVTRLLAVAAVLALPNMAAAQVWKPDSTVEIIVAAGAGGGADRSGRFLQSVMQERQFVPAPVVVVNKPGAGGAVGLNYLLQHPGSGHHLMMASPTLLTAHVVGRIKTAPSDVTPIGLLYTDYMMVAVRADSPIKTGKELIDRLKKDPQSVSITVGVGLGNINHIAVGMPLEKGGVEVSRLKVVVFKSISDAVTAVLGGHVDVVSGTAAIMLPHMQAGNLRIIASASPKRLGGVFSSVPTWKEQGIDAESALYHYVVGAQGMKPEQVAYWEGVLGRVVATDEWKRMLEKYYLTEGYMRSAETRKFLDAQYVELHSILNNLGLVKTAK